MHFFAAAALVGSGTARLVAMFEARFECGGMKPENLQIGNVNCLVLWLYRRSVSLCLATEDK